MSLCTAFNTFLTGAQENSSIILSWCPALNTGIQLVEEVGTLPFVHDPKNDSKSSSFVLFPPVIFPNVFRAPKLQINNRSRGCGVPVRTFKLFVYIVIEENNCTHDSVDKGC